MTLALASAQVLGGLALFIYGMNVMCASLQRIAGQRLKTYLYGLTRRRLAGLAVGTGLGALVHSSAATVMLVGFVNAGLVTLVQAIPVLLGANIGTTLSMQVVSFEVGKYCFVAIAAGFALSLLPIRQWVRDLGSVLFGLGLLFLGMTTMSAAVAPLKDAGVFELVLRHTDGATIAGMIAGVVLSTLFTGIIQSSGATIGILFALASGGVLTSFTQAFPLMLGAHIGTCATALLGSIGTQIEARRTAVAHLLFNLLGAVVALAMIRFYAWLIPSTADSLVRQIANAHTLVQTVNAALLLPFVGLYARLVVALTPSKAPPIERSHLDDAALATPEQAIVVATRELQRMARVTRAMLQASMRGLLEFDPGRFPAVKKDEEVVDTLKQSIVGYLMKIAEHKLSKRQAIILQYLIAAASDLERIGDHIESLTTITEEKLAKQVWFDNASMTDLIELFRKADHILASIVRSLEPRFYEAPQDVALGILSERDAYAALSMQVRARYNQRILDGKETALNGVYFFRYVTCFNKLVKHSKCIALVEKEPLFLFKRHKLDRTAERLPPNQPIDKAVAYDQSIFALDEPSDHEQREP